MKPAEASVVETSPVTVPGVPGPVGQTAAEPQSIPNGAAIAAYLAAMIGMLAMGIVVFACEASKAFSEKIYALGKGWMPGADGIGPYSGKETILLLAWLGSWAILHPLLRRKHLDGYLGLTLFLAGVGIATTLVWPPVWHFFLDHSSK
ncbi:MAG: hypothetical protein HYU36_05270 [Planctomycetes bacterium]|nr:hypothetical protein [Planctomycetota bacterium]